MFTQAKRMVIALATIFFLIGTIPTALAQTFISASMEHELESITKNSLVPYYYKSDYSYEVQLIYSDEENAVTVKTRQVDVPTDMSVNIKTCSFEGFVTGLSGPYPYPPYYDQWRVHVSGQLTYDWYLFPGPVTISASGYIELTDVNPEHYPYDFVRASLPFLCHTQYFYGEFTLQP